jgi:phenylpyruvate tautomerase PptA (4-oxalocrotonate tautomerase family)
MSASSTVVTSDDLPCEELAAGCGVGNVEGDAMPLVRISLIKGKPPEYIRAIADGVHRALHEAYNAPPDDRFQVIDEYDPGKLIYDPDYFGVHRTDDIVIVSILAGRWRDTPTKQAFYKRVVELLAEKPGVAPANVQIFLSPNDRDDWSFGNGIAHYVKG